MRFLIILAILFIGCSNNGKKDQNITQKETNQSVTKPKTNDTKTVMIEDLNLTFKKDRLIYPDKKVILLFENGFKQADVLDMLKVKYYRCEDEYVQKYFNIKEMPTIIILDKNKTIRFENYTPYAILKVELKEEGF
ncbi:MAG: hypothetical protein GXO62_05640 [Epsilonproteobacteria bacterium]|nr:hypothetical protein [Campylobacterota bacterium]